MEVRVGLRGAATLLFAIAVAGCGGSPTPPRQNYSGGTPPPGGPPAGAPGLAASVTVSDNQFAPSTVTILKTGTVTWNWSGGYATPHNVTFTDADSGDKTDGQYQRTFPDAGVYTYKCTNHPTTMTGTVTVQ